MRILVFGGTVFLGRAIVEAALQRGHELTLFNRGQSNPQLFPQVEKVHGDRTQDISGLQGRQWDAVIDVNGYVPRFVRMAAEQVSTGHYTFISTVSVYKDNGGPTDENSPVGTLEDPTVEQVTGETYGPLKALCEQAVQEAHPGQALIIRPGLIVGPHDPTDRFTYWPHRVAQGGEVLAPAPGTQPVQVIDVRDLAEWTVRMVESGQTGVFNATGPEPRLTMAQVAETCKQVSGSDARFTWVSDEFLLEHEVEPWMGLPLWVPHSDPEFGGVFAAVVDRAIAAGLTFRPLSETVRATLEWLKERPADKPWRAGLSREREAELLAEWDSRS